MAKVMNTKWFVDRHSHNLSLLYESRLGCKAAELTVDSANEPQILKALTEMRLYRLPDYFKVPTVIKSRIQAQGATCYNVDDLRMAAAIERELTHKFSSLFYVRRQNEPCSKCGARRASLDGICYRCASSNEGQARELSREYNLNRGKDIDPVEGWYSPKTVLMATEFGCVSCGKKATPEWIWDEDLEGWGDGLCPDCLHNFPLGYEWSLPTNLRANAPQESYEFCQSCGQSEYPYALWSMCELCYGEWQDRYLEAELLYDLVDRWGALSALLIRSSPDWITFLKGQLENRYCWSTKTKSFPKDHVIVPWKPKLPRTRSLKDVGVNLNEML